ncbi:MAG: DUF2179 domain-containing protein [Bacteroidota bacterium]
MFKGQGGYGSGGVREEQDILYVVITRLEIRKLTIIVQQTDPRAFITMSSISDVHGGMIKKKALK